LQIFLFKSNHCANQYEHVAVEEVTLTFIIVEVAWNLTSREQKRVYKNGVHHLIILSVRFLSFAVYVSKFQ